jgi:hypothetical protein
VPRNDPAQLPPRIPRGAEDADRKFIHSE